MAVHLRYNPGKAGTSDLNLKGINDVDDTASHFKRCYRNFGWCGIALVVIFGTAIGIAVAATKNGPSSSSFNYTELCSYDNNGVGLCASIVDIFKSIFGN
jgi:hypothetical protein